MNNKFRQELTDIIKQNINLIRVRDEKHECGNRYRVEGFENAADWIIHYLKENGLVKEGKDE